MKKRARAPILDRAFVWHKSDTHSDPALFAARMEARRKQIQAEAAKPQNVRAIRKAAQS